jgi:hypothetical protein
VIPFTVIGWTCRHGWPVVSFAVLTGIHRNSMKWYLYDFMWYSKARPRSVGPRWRSVIFGDFWGSMGFLHKTIIFDKKYSTIMGKYM